MTDLIRELEQAAEGSRRLDEIIFVHTECGGDFKSLHFAARAGARRDGWNPHAIPHYTTSIDAALTLVPEGWCGDVEVGDCGNLEGKRGHLWNGEFAPDAREVRSEAHTPALALCIAALKAREGAKE